MTVYIGNAVGDEHDKARGGEAGDQTGRELRIQPWYLNEKGWRVFRAKSADTAKRIADDMRLACDNPCIGYDQKQRSTLYTVSAPLDFDAGRVTTPCECDCSSLVRVCVAFAGIKTKDFNSVSGPARLLATGEFIELTDDNHTKKSAYLCTGDILCTKVKGHMAVVLNDGPKADRDPEPQPIPPVVKQEVEVIGRSVNVRNADSTKGGTLFTAHRGDRFPFVCVAPSGWYQIETRKGTGYITNLPRYTKLVET
jgi:hypothetical protein